jgi:A/G-specific adenine glycosylase
MSVADPAQVRRRLRRWYQRRRRDLPWRRTRDPYAIWISETMLQQTQVETVIAYYARFMKIFPTVSALDRAPLRNVLALWSGLGYYRRAENLKKSARLIMDRHGGRLPRDYEKLRQLPGVGEYTAGALLSIAFDEAYPAVDGNARRVLARLFLLAKDTAVRHMARKLLTRVKPGEVNQALMELGSTICTAAHPRCRACPLRGICAARRSASAHRFGVAPKKTETQSVVWPLAIMRRQGKLLLRRRAAGGALGGLWEFPGDEYSEPVAVGTLLGDCPAELHRAAAEARPIGEFRHNITHRRIRAPVFLIECPGGSKISLDRSRWRWVAPAALCRQPTSAMTRKAMQLLGDYEKTVR